MSSNSIISSPSTASTATSSTRPSSNDFTFLSPVKSLAGYVKQNYFEVVLYKGHSKVKCTFCGNNPSKYLSTTSSSSTLLKHVQSQHIPQSIAIEEEYDKIDGHGEVTNSVKHSKSTKGQMTLAASFSKTQDKDIASLYAICFAVNGLAHEIAEKETFINLLNGYRSSSRPPLNRKLLKSAQEEEAGKMREKVLNSLSDHLSFVTIAVDGCVLLEKHFQLFPL
jgi:hypothetical protein